MSSIKNQKIGGDASVGRNVAMGGNGRIAGSLIIGHNLQVKGWLEAPNIKDTNKGVFASVESLSAAYPSPRDGWFAGVGESTPFDLYVAEGGAWVATGGEIDVEVDLDYYNGEIERIDGDIHDLTDGVSANSEAIEQHDGLIEGHTQQIAEITETLTEVQQTATAAKEQSESNADSIGEHTEQLTALSSAVSANSQSIAGHAQQIEQISGTLAETRGTADEAKYQSNANAVNISRVNALVGYFECSTTSSVSAKTITANSFSRIVGGCMHVKMHFANTASSVTLNINGTGAIALYYNGKHVSARNTWEDDEIVVVFFDGDEYQAFPVGAKYIEQQSQPQPSQPADFPELDELEERVGSLERAAGQHNVLPFDGTLSFPSVTPSDTLYEHTIQPREGFEYSICLISVLGSVRFCLKVGNAYYNNWSIKKQFSSDGLIPVGQGSIDDPYSVPTGTYTEEISNNDWYSGELHNKVFYNRSNKVVYAYNCETKSLEAMTNIQVVEENAPEAESTSNPNNSTKGSIVVDLEHDKMLTWDGNKWKELSGGGSTSEDVPNHLDVRNGILYLERVENGETTQLSHVVLPNGGEGGTTYDLVELNKNLGDNALSDIAVSNDNKLVLRDRTTADGGKNVVTLRENLVTGKRHTCTVVVKKGMPNPVTNTATTTPENNIVRITINGTTYEVTLSHIAEIANAVTSPDIPGVTTAEAKAAVNNSYPAAKYVAKHIAANFLSNIYNFTTKKIRVPYDSKYVSENGTEKVIFTKCALIGTQDSIPATSSITIKYHGRNSFAEDSELFSISDNVSMNISLNVLTQEMITPANTDRTNTVFKVQIDYDLQGQEIDIPEGCILQMDGGSITNGYLRGNNTICTDFTAIGAELIGTWRNNDGEIVDNGLRRVRKTDATLGAYFYIGGHPGVSGCKKVELYRYLKKVGMGDVNMLEVKKARGNQFHINGTGGRYYLEYQYGKAINPPIEVNGRPIYTVSPFTVKENGVDVTKYKATIVTNEDYKEGTIYVQKPAFLGLEGVLTIEENGQQKTIFDGSNPDPLVPDTVVNGQVVWGNADLIGLGLFLRLGIDTLSFLKFQGGTCGTDAAYTTYSQVTHLQDDPVPPEPSNYIDGEDDSDYIAALTTYNNKVNAVATGDVHLFQRDADGTEMVNRINNIKNYELKYIKRLKDIGFKFDTVYVMNEAPITCNKGGAGELSGSSQRRATILNAFVNDLINPIKAEGYKVGVTFSMLQSYTRCLPEFYSALDEMGLNFYQPISFDEEHLSDEDDFTEDMKVAMQNALRGDINKKPKKRLCITEGGAGNWRNVLRETAGQRYDTYVNKGGNPSLDLDHSTPGHIYFKSMLKAAAALDAKRINLWFTINLETSHVEDTIIYCFYK